MSGWKVLLVLLTPLGRLQAQAQSAAIPQGPPAVTAAITGFVYDGDTRSVIRFAEINVVPIPATKTVPSNEEQPTASDVPQQRDRRMQRINGTSGMEGSFRLNVPEGDYFVAALKPGYITQGVNAALDFSLSEEQIQSLTDSLPRVHVGAGGTANVNLTLRRGAVISGRIQFADGSPAIGAAVNCESIESIRRLESAFSPQNKGRVPPPLQEALIALTTSQHIKEKSAADDEGRYRIFGVSPGKYLVSTIISTEVGTGRVTLKDGSDLSSGHRQQRYPDLVSVYAPSTFRRDNAKRFEVSGNEQIADANLTIDPNGLHTLQGRVLAAEDHHAPETMIRLKEKEAKLASRLVETDADGTFHVNYLPPGTYVLQIVSHDPPDVTKPALDAVQYKIAELSAVIGEHDVVLDDLLLVRLKPGEHIDYSSFF